MKKTTLALLAVAALPAAVGAYHRQTPPIVAITSSGDNVLPRVPSGGLRLVVALNGSGRQIFRQHRRRNFLEQITTVGDNDNPTTSKNASVIAWDSDCTLLGCPEPGRQIFMWARGSSFQVSHDPTGTSTNPALSGRGDQVAWESRGNLAGAGNGGSWQIFVRGIDGTVTQVTHGSGTSRNAVFDLGGRSLVLESTNAANGADTGVSQIWFQSPYSPLAPITSGDGPSHAPAISPDGHVIVFQSSSALTTDRHDTGVNQIFVYESPARQLTQITNDPQGCTGASACLAPGDYRIGYVCHGQAFFRLLRANQSFRVPIPTGADTPQAVAELGGHFMMVSTTGNLLGTGTTTGHELYLLNFFKLAAEPVN